VEEFMRVLLAYDGSDYAREALEDLSSSGLGTDCELLVMCVADVLIPPPIDSKDAFPTTEPAVVKLAHERLRNKLQEAEDLASYAGSLIKSKFPTWHVQYEANADSPAWAILKKADEWKPDLIILGARGLSVFGGRLILGSISQRVLYEAPCSVRIARAPSQPGKPVRILVGIDNSGDSNAAVDAVCRRVWPPGSEVGLLVVVDTVMAVPSGSDQSEMKWIDVSEEKDWDQVREIIEPSAQRLRDAGLHTEILIRRGNPSDELLDEAHGWDADCIFVGARGARGVERLLLGSVSSAVAARAHCSVEVVKIPR
jgi:nucleotide-binding universal stress UspA family protein